MKNELKSKDAPIKQDPPKYDLSDMFNVRIILEDAIRAAGGEIEGAGSMLVDPYTMDIAFTLRGHRYSLDLNIHS